MFYKDTLKANMFLYITLNKPKKKIKTFIDEREEKKNPAVDIVDLKRFPSSNLLLTTMIAVCVC